MPEIIELLSSSPPKPEQQPRENLPSKIGFSEDVFNFGSDDFDITGDLDFLVEQPSKRRRLSPPPAITDNDKPSKALREDVFDLSSEGNFLDEPVKGVTHKPVMRPQMDEFDIDDPDMFRFSSSAPEPTQRTFPKEPFVLELSSDTEPAGIVNPFQNSSPPRSSRKLVLSERTANLVASLRSTNHKSFQKPKAKPRSKRSISADHIVRSMDKFKQITKSSVVSRVEAIDSSQPETSKPKTKPIPANSGVDVQSKPASKVLSKADREAEKERKRKEKEQKAIEKQKAADIAEANKSKTNKKNSTPEMIVDMPASLQGLSVGKQVEDYMKELGVQVTFSREEAVDTIIDNEVSFGHIVKWRRKVVAEYDEALGIRVPLSEPCVTRENHILVYLKAEELINLAVRGGSCSVNNASDVSETTMKAKLDTHVQSLRTRYPNNTILYIIEGLAAWNRKSQTIKNRAYTAAVRSQAPADESSTTSAAQPRRPASTTNNKRLSKTTPQLDLSSINPDLTENLLLHLQLHHQPLLIHHTTSVASTASQISTFTQHLSTRPYRVAEQSHNLASASFCMTTGQIRTGATPHETYINMLQEINRVTPSMAYGISSAGYRNVAELVTGFRKHGNLMLEDVRKSVNKDGAWSDRRLGPMVSKRLYRVFMGRDPGARDGIA